MAQTPRFRTISREDYPDAPEWFDTFITSYNEAVGGLVDALDQGLTREENFASKGKTGIAFKTTAAGNAVVDFANGLTTSPQHVWLTNLKRKDGAALTVPFSMTWTLSSKGTVQCTLLGLSASTDYLLSVLYE